MSLSSSGDSLGTTSDAGIEGYVGTFTTTLLTSLIVTLVGTAIVEPRRSILLLITASFILASAAMGHLLISCIERFSRRPVLPIFNTLPRLGINVGTGLAALSLIFTLTAMAGVFRAAIVFTALMAIHGLFKAILAVRRIRIKFDDLPALASGLLVGVFWLLVWLWSTIPPVFYDELAFHLLAPERTLATTSLHTAPWVVFTLTPHSSELLLAWGMVSAGDVGARATLYALWIVSFIAAWGLVEVLIRPKTSGWAVPMSTCALATAPTFWYFGTLAFAETALVTAVLVAAVILAHHDSNDRPWFVMGMLLGFIASIKLSGVMWAGAIMGAMLLLRWSRREAALSGLIALMGILPWWGRAFYYTGNPLYPMAHQMIGGRGWGSENQALLMQHMPYGGKLPGLGELVCLPWEMLSNPDKFGAAPDVGVLALAVTGFFLLFPLWARLRGMAANVRQLVDALAFFVLVTGVGWMMTAMVTRYFAPALILCLVVFSAMAVRLDRGRQPVVLTLLLVLAIWGGWRFIQQHEIDFASRDVALGKAKADAYLTSRLDHYQAARYVREHVPANARLLFIGETMPYYFAREAIAPSFYDNHPLKRWVEESASTGDLVRRLAAEGVTHIVVNSFELESTRHHRNFAGLDKEAAERRYRELFGYLPRIYSEAGMMVFVVPDLPSPG